MGRRIASESKQTVRGGPKPAKVGLHRRLVYTPRSDNLIHGVVLIYQDTIKLLK